MSALGKAKRNGDDACAGRGAVGDRGTRGRVVCGGEVGMGLGMGVVLVRRMGAGVVGELEQRVGDRGVAAEEAAVAFESVAVT